MRTRIPVPLHLLAIVALIAAGCSREAPDAGEAGSPATVGRTATAPRPEDLAATETLAEQAASAAGQSVFIDQGCTMCHSAASANIRGMSDAGPDLGGAGERRGGRDGIIAFLRSGEHSEPWEGTDAELTSVAEWLADL